MRTSAIAVAILALTTLPNSLSASDDFSALLADLSFGDAPSLSEPAANRSLTIAQDETVTDLKPVPTGIVMPQMIESTPQDAVASDVTAQPQVESAPQVALQDPIPATSPEPQIDMESAFALQGSPSAVPTQTVGHILDHSGSHACDSVITCRPHNKVNLPSSTFLQYFRSNACNTNVWDGYRQHCGKHLTHLNGQCDCFKKSGKASCGGNDCVNCDAGCDR